MTSKKPSPRPLSQVDAFFVAYQEQSGILMQLGGEFVVRGPVRRDTLEQTLAHLVARWPQLGQTLRRRLFGLAWAGHTHLDAMLHRADDRDALPAWRNQPIDPFKEPPFQVLWIPGDDHHVLAFRAHHAVADGEAFITVVVEAFHILATLTRGTPLPEPETTPPTKFTDHIHPLQLLRQGQWGPLWRYTRWLAREARAERSARLAMHACIPGDIAICERAFDPNSIIRLRNQAAEGGVPPFWLCMAAWLKAIHAWNTTRNADTSPLLSLEVPVSLRREEHHRDHLGNLISPLVLFGDASQPLDELARALRRAFLGDVRKRAYLGMPLFSAPGRYLPWPVFRRVAVTTTSTGFATSHYTWLPLQTDFFEDVTASSKGTLAITNLQMHTPVCLHMGAALTVLDVPGYTRIFITYRRAALTTADAETLADLLAASFVQHGEEPSIVKEPL